MGRKLSKVFGTKESRATNRSARAELETYNRPGVSEDDPGYLAATQRVADTEPGYRRNFRRS